LSDFSITGEQRQQLLNGTYEPLKFDIKPMGCEKGSQYILSYSKAKSIWCDDGHVIRLPREPVWFIRVTGVQRLRKGGWRVEYSVVDRRDPDLYIRRTPPVMTPDESTDETVDERARRQSSYQTTRWGAVDDVPAVPPAWLEEHAKELYERDSHKRLERNLSDRAERFRWKRERKRAA
jgi:hypothetical protein